MRVALFVLMSFAVACTDDDPAPSVRVISATPDALVPDDDLADDLRIVVEYADRDGDLGDGVARVHDCRAEQLQLELAIPAIAPDAVIGSRITGTLDLHVNDVGVTMSGALPALCDELGVRALASDETVFCVVLVDAAGNTSTGDCTAPIGLAP